MMKTIQITLKFSFLLVLLAAFFLDIKQASAATSSKAWLKQAIIKRQAGDYWQAVDILFKLRDKHEAHKRINLELVLNFIKLRQYERAETILVYLNSLPLTELEQEKLDKLQKILVKKMRRPISAHQWTIDAGASVGHDVVHSQFPVLIIEDYQFEDGSWLSDDLDDQAWEGAEFGDYDYTDGYELITRGDETERKESSYLSEFANINYRYRPLDKLTWFKQATYLIWDNDLSVELRQIDDDNNSKYNRVSAESSMYLLRVNSWLAEFGVKASIHYSDGNRLLTDTRERITITLPYQQHKFKFAFDYSQKHYPSVLTQSNAKTSMPWFEYAYSLSDEWRATIGYRHKQLRANDDFLSYNTNGLFAGLYYYPNTDLSAYFSVNYYELKYRIDDPEIVNWAKEDKLSLAAGVKYYINENLSISLNGHYSKNTIELGFGEDEWQRFEASIMYRF